MALTVEAGTGAADSESYVSVADCAAWAVKHGKTFPSSPAATAEAALRRATAFIDAAYRGRFPGRRLNGRDQALEWPRIEAADRDGEDIASDEVPDEIVTATCEAAVRELATPGSLAPDMKRGGAVKSVKAGSVSVEFMGNAPAETTFKAIDQALAPLLTATSGGLVGRAVRG